MAKKKSVKKAKKAIGGFLNAVGTFATKTEKAFGQYEENQRKRKRQAIQDADLEIKYRKKKKQLAALDDDGDSIFSGMQSTKRKGRSKLDDDGDSIFSGYL